MGNNTNSLPIDTPSTYEVQKAVSQLTDRDLGFAKEKNQYHTEIDLANQEKEITLATIEENTKNDSDDLAESSDNEYQDILHNLPNGLQDIDKQLRFTARRGKTKEIRQIAREYRKEFVKDMKYTCRTLGIYFRKVRNGRFDENMITPAQMQILNAKVQAWHDKIKGFIGDTLTGDNVLAERSDKKDNFVGPDVNVKTDGVEWRGTYTSEQANAMANTCTQQQTAERKKKYYGMIDKNVNIPIFGNTGNQVVKTSLKLLPDIVRLGIGIKYGIDTVKGIFGLFSKDGRTPEALWQLTKSAGIFSLAAFTDIDKASAYVGSRFSNASKTYSNNGESNIGSNAEIISGLSALKPGESLPFGYGETLMGKAFAVPGVTVGEVNQEQIVTYNGNRPIGINFSKLKKLYSNKMNSNQGDIPKYTQAISNVNDLEIAYSKLKTKEQREEFMDTMTKVGMSKEVFENPELNDKEVSLFMASAMKTAEILPELGQRLIISDKIYSNKDVESYISANSGKEKLMDEIMKLPDSMRLGIEKGDIILSLKDNKLCLSSMNNESILDLSTKELYNSNRNGEFVKLPLQLTDTTELLILGQEQNRIRNTFQSTSLYPKSFFLDKTGNDMEFMKGPRERSDPTSRWFGQKETALAGGVGSGLSGKVPKINDNMKILIDYENSLDLWMTDAIHDKYTQLVELMKTSLPNLKPGTAEYDAVVLSLLHLATMPTASEITGMVKEGDNLRVTFKDGSKKLFSDLVGGMNISDRRNSNHKMASIGAVIGGVIYGTGEGIINLWKGFYKASGIETGVNAIGDTISNTRNGLFGKNALDKITPQERKQLQELSKKDKLTSQEKQELDTILKKVDMTEGSRKELKDKMNKAIKDGGERFVDPNTGEWRLKKIGGQIVDRSSWAVSEGLEKAAYGLGRFMVGIKTAIIAKIRGLGRGIVGKRNDEQRIEHRQESMMTPELAIKKTYKHDLESLYTLSQGTDAKSKEYAQEYTLALQKAQDYQNKRKLYEIESATDVRSELESGGTDFDITKKVFSTLEKDEKKGKREGDQSGFIERVKYVGYMRAAYEDKLDITQEEKEKLETLSKKEEYLSKKDKITTQEKKELDDIKKEVHDIKNKIHLLKKESLQSLFPKKVDSIMMGCYFFTRNRLFDMKDEAGKIGTHIENSTINSGAEEIYKQVIGGTANTDQLNAIKSIITYIQKNVQ